MLYPQQTYVVQHRKTLSSWGTLHLSSLLRLALEKNRAIPSSFASVYTYSRHRRVGPPITTPEAEAIRRHEDVEEPAPDRGADISALSNARGAAR